MAAASSGDPGGSGRRLPPYMDPTNSFGELTFLQLAGKDDKPLPKNPFIISRSVENVAGGPIEGASTEAQGTRYTLKVRNPTQVKKLLEMAVLIDNTEVVVKPHPNLNISRCVISSYDLIDMDERDILQGMISQSVIRVQRITRNEGGKRVNTPALILTFCKTTYPEYLKIGLLHVPTRPYFPNPMLCYGCFSYGHTRLRCPGPKRCFNCSTDHPEVEECDKAAFCRNCKGDHRPTNRQCSVYKNETEIIKMKINENLTFPEARKRVEAQKQGSYAQAAAQQSAIEKRLAAMETAMRQKDDQISKLMEEVKQKTEKLNHALGNIEQLKQKIVELHHDKHRSQSQTRLAQEKAHHSRDRELKVQISRELSQIPQKNGPNTRSRNNSPVVPENKRGRPTKNQSKPTTTLPERLSPPPKKVAHNTEMEVQSIMCSDEDTEIAETPSNQPLR